MPLEFSSRRARRVSRWTSSCVFILGQAVLFGSAAAQTEGARAPWSSPLTRGTVVSLCLTSQGNGFNWSSSLAWASESYEEAVRFADDQFVNGIEASFDVSCAAGSSSAAASVALLAALFGNNALGWSSPNPLSRPLLASDLRIASRALRLLAMATDFDPDEKAATAARFVFPESDGKGEWWKSQYGESLIRSIFARRIHLASRLQAEDLRLEVPSPENRSRGLLVTDFLEFRDAAELPVVGSPNAKKAHRFLKKQQEAVHAIQRKRLGGDAWGWNARAGAFLASAPVPDGFMTTAFALVEPVQANGTIRREEFPPAFPRARKVVFANKSTISKLVSSTLYRSVVDSDEGDSRNFVFAEVQNLADFMRVSQAEPENQALMAAPLPALGVRSFFDPRFDTSSSFELRERPDLGLVVLGGWTNPETSAWPLTLYQFAKVLDREQAFGSDVRAVSLRFGKPGRQATFPQRVLKEYFFRNKDGSVPSPVDANIGAYLDEYYADMETFESFHSARAAAFALDFETRKDTFNWDIAKRPAAAGGLSQELLIKTVNALRAGRVDANGRSLPVVFDPL